MRAAFAAVTIFFVALTGTAEAQTYDTVELQIYTTWETAHPGTGALAVEIARCEGWNATANWDVAHRSSSGDVGPMQINQVHDDNPRSALRVLFGDATRWPGPAATLDGNLTVAIYLYEASGGWGPWANSRHCWGWALDAFIAPLEPAATPEPTPTEVPRKVTVFKVLTAPPLTPTPTPTSRPAVMAVRQVVLPALDPITEEPHTHNDIRGNTALAVSFMALLVVARKAT